jgi:hypothetical protein
MNPQKGKYQSYFSDSEMLDLPKFENLQSERFERGFFSFVPFVGFLCAFCGLALRGCLHVTVSV